jgi:hypothetical protein
MIPARIRPPAAAAEQVYPWRGDSSKFGYIG